MALRLTAAIASSEGDRNGILCMISDTSGRLDNESDRSERFNEKAIMYEIESIKSTQDVRSAKGCFK